VTLSIQESIERLKAEIIAPDWQLGSRRAALLKPAIFCLKQRYTSRKALHALLTMAGSVVDYRERNENLPSAAIDFLKETLAHIVTLHEEKDFVPEKEEKIFQRIYNRFKKLKKEIQATLIDDGGRQDILGGEVSTGQTDTAVASTPPGVDVAALVTELQACLDKAKNLAEALRQVLADAQK